MSAASPKKNVPDLNVLASAVRLLPLNHSSCRRYSQQQPFIEKLVKNLHRVQQSAEETTQKWVRTLLESNNPVLRFYLALRADYCNFLQIRCRNISRSNSIAAHNFAAILPGDSLAGLVVTNGISNFLNLYNTLLVVRLVLTWFPSVPPAIVSPLSTICDPYLNIFRGLIPPLGGTLDLSPILAFLVLNAFTSTAAALPAELPPSMSSSVYSPSSGPASGNVTSVQTMWLKRLGNGRSK